MSSDGSGQKKPETYLWTNPDDDPSKSAANEWVRRASSRTDMTASLPHTSERSHSTKGSINKAHAILKGRTALRRRVVTGVLFFMLPFAVLLLVLAQTPASPSSAPKITLDIPLPDIVLANINPSADITDASTANANTAVTADITSTTPVSAPVFASDATVPTFTISQNTISNTRIDLGPPAINLHLAPPLLD